MASEQHPGLCARCGAPLKDMPTGALCLFCHQRLAATVEHAERALKTSAEAYRLVEEAVQMREERDAALAALDAMTARAAALTEAGNALADEAEDALWHIVTDSVRSDLGTAATAWRALADDTPAAGPGEGDS